ncbi:phage baseplate assembly protein V, partial [Salmonella enterica]|nr:phage baseplate assembly protein V [Salmonella enterica]
MMSQDMGDLARRVANMIRRGVVQAVKHGPQPQCRVEIGDITTTWLPVFQSSSSANRADSNPIAVGDAVTVISEAGDLNNGRVLPGWNT